MTNPEISAIREALATRPKLTEISDRRAAQDANARNFPLSSDIKVESLSANGVPAEWTSAPGADRTRAVLYLHGGGNVVGSLDSHRHLCAQIARELGVRTLALHYRRAPENAFPAAADDALAGYRFLLALGLKPQNIAFAGDSSGGGLVVATMVSARDAKLPQPAIGWCISPWVDLECTGQSMTALADKDPMITRAGLLGLANSYLNGADPRSPLASPLYADLRGIAPLFIQTGGAEVLLDDTTRLASTLGAADTPVVVEIWPEMIHAWHILFPKLAAGRRAISSGVRHVREALDGAPSVIQQRE